MVGVLRILARMRLLSVKYDKAEAHISGQVPALAALIAQVHMFGHTRTLGHWRKELAAVVGIIQDNAWPSGKLMKIKDMQECLREIAENRAVTRAFKALDKDPDYSAYQAARSTPPTQDQSRALVDALVLAVLHTDDSKWDIADQLISTITEWI